MLVCTQQKIKRIPEKYSQIFSNHTLLKQTKKLRVFQ